MKLFLRLLCIPTDNETTASSLRSVSRKGRFKFLLTFRWQVALAIFLGSATIASNIGLLSMAAYLIAAAALGPLLVTLTLPISIVRFAGVSRATARYTERMVSHNVTFRLLAQLRTWVYTRLELLAPGHLLTYRSGDILSRLVSARLCTFPSGK